MKKIHTNLLLFCFVGLFLIETLSLCSNLYAKTQLEKKVSNFHLKHPSVSKVPRNIIKARVKFWEDIFYRYPSSSVLIHDTKYPELVIDIIDFKKLGVKYPGILKSRSLQNQIVSKYLSRYKLATKRISQEGLKALRFGKMEERIVTVYLKNKFAYEDLLAGKSSLRTQSGISGEFYAAVKRSNKYMKKMEHIFEKQNIPKEYTRLAFVESMFNTSAVSSVGATGIWQLMPDAVLGHLKINKYVDERRSVYKSTLVAAKILKQNYQKLKSWPLAITAYNHGLGGVQAAVNYTKSSNLNDIVREYYGKKNFGFSSSNFYAEYVAARNIYNKYRHTQKLLKFDALATRTKKPVRLSYLIDKLKIDKSTFMELNPCIKHKTYRSSNFYLPSGYELYIPKNKRNLLSLVDTYVYKG